MGWTARHTAATTDREYSRKSVLLRMLGDTKPIAGWLLLGALINVAAISLGLIAPEVLGRITDILYNIWKNGGGDVSTEVFHPCLMLALIYFCAAICELGNMILMNNVVSKYFSCTLRVRISDKIRRMPVSYIDSVPNGEIISRMTDDVSIIGSTIHRFIDTIINGVLKLIFIAVLLVNMNWQMAICIMVFVPVSLWIASRISNSARKYHTESRTANGLAYSIMEESFTGFGTVKAFSLEARRERELGAYIDQKCSAKRKGDLMSGIVSPIIALSNNVAYIIICLLGGYLALKGTMTVGTIVACILYAKQFAGPLEAIAEGMSSIQSVMSAASRVYSLLDEEEMPVTEDRPGMEDWFDAENRTGTEDGFVAENRPGTEDGLVWGDGFAMDNKPVTENQQVMKERSATGGMFSGGKIIRGTVDFENVSFAYVPERPLIEDMNVHVKPGQKIAIVGPTGGGKTTIVNLLMRFYDITSGKIYIDGHDISTMDRAYLRSMFGMVLQDTWLFSGTIFDNIAYGKENATEEEVYTAAKKAHIDRFIRSLPDGYQTVINEESTNISGGQKQLLTIARAYLSNRPMLILDEATSNVDTRTEILIQKTMDELMKGRTSFVIAHRLSTIVDADVILVVRNGHIVEQGTHKELMAKNGFYTEIYNSQYALLKNA